MTMFNLNCSLVGVFRSPDHGTSMNTFASVEVGKDVEVKTTRSNDGAKMGGGRRGSQF